MAGMKAKTIKAVLRKKIEDWVSTIEEPAVKEAVQKDTIVTGGCIASMLLGEEVNDVDVYFRHKETAVLVANYYLARFKPAQKAGIGCKMEVVDAGDRVKIVIKSAGIASEDGTPQPYRYFEGVSTEGAAAAYVDDIMATVVQDRGEIQDAFEQEQERAREAEDEGKPRYRPVFMSTNAIMLSQRLQIVLRFFGEPDEIHANYDFAHCMNYWQSWDGHLELRAKSLEALLARELRYAGSKYPICSLFRVRKFVARGWRINAGQILKMVMQISELDLKDIKVLEDQLTGVDVAYFTELVVKLKEKDPEKVNSAYLVEILDRMF
jgi:hypothetical protein